MRALDRRRFISLGVGVLGAAAALQSCSGRSSSADAGDKDFSARVDRAVVTALLMRLFPHDNLDPRAYEKTAEIVEAKLSADPNWSEAFRAELDALDGLSGGDWLAADADAQTDHLAAIIDRPVFKTFYSVALAEFYSNPTVWAHIGYEGPSAEHGGYINRGFDDIDWLPEARG